MKKPFVCIFLLRILLVHFSCKKAKIDGDAELINGRWLWTKATYINTDEFGQSNTIVVANQDTDGTQNYIEIRKEGIVLLYKNNKKIERFRVRKIETHLDEYPTLGKKYLSFTFHFWGKKNEDMYGRYDYNSGEIEIFQRFLIDDPNHVYLNLINHFTKL